MDQITISHEDRKLLGFALACYIEDQEKTIKRQVKPEFQKGAREQLSRIARITYLLVNPEALVGEDTLPDGSKIKPGDKMYEVIS